MQRNLWIRMIPLPAEVLDKAIALEWLREWSSAYLTLARIGLHCEDAKVRDVFLMLSIEIDLMIEACTEAISEDTGLRIEQDAPRPSDVDFLSTVSNLATIVTTPDPDGWGGGPYEAAREALGCELRRRVALLERARESAPGAA